MAVSREELEKHKHDYEAVTGKKVVNGFVCPITLEDMRPDQLCKGHVLNDAIEDASGVKVAQRADVDRYFGQTIEPEFIRFVNLPTKTSAELLKAAREFTVTLPSGEQVGGFFAGKSARAKYQQVDLLDPEGNSVAAPFFRVEKLDPHIYRDLKVEWLMVFNNSAMLGTVLKSAYLALFRLLGYRWIMQTSTDKVRRHLLAFYRAGATKEQAKVHFGDFNGAFNVMFNDITDDHWDTLKDGLFWMHYTNCSGVQFLFALTCLFKVNGKIITATLPMAENNIDYFLTMREYKRFLRNRGMQQNIFPAKLIDEVIHRGIEPLKVGYKPMAPPAA